jgi:phenylalanyl-tRNA synthetase beta chain
MGGLESEITASTSNILLEGASWNFINTRRTVAAKNYRAKPVIAFRAISICFSQIRGGIMFEPHRGMEWGSIASGVVDEYPLPYIDPIWSLHRRCRAFIGISYLL